MGKEADRGEGGTVVRLEGIEPFCRFIADLTKAYGCFFALTAEEFGTLPPKAKRGVAQLQAAFRDFGATPARGPVDVRSAHHLDPVSYQNLDAG